MSPDIRARITAKNETRPVFGEVVKDANVAADAVVAGGRRANAALASQSNALTAMGKSSAMAANQQRNLVFQLNDVAVSLAGGANPLMVFAQQGSQIASIYGPEEGGLGRALKETASMATGLVTKFWPIAALVAGGTAAIAGMTAAINDSSDADVSFGDVATATWQVFAEGAYNIAQPAIAAVGGWIGDMWSASWPVIKDLGNGIIATFIGAFDASRQVWSAFPAVMGDITITTANNVIGGVEAMINGAIGLLNDFKSSMGFAGDIGDVKLSGVENPFEGATSGLASDVVASFQGAFDVDYLGGLFDAIKTKAIALASATDEVGKAAKSAGKDMKPFSLGLEAANDNAGKLSESLAGGLTQGVMSIWQAFKSGGNVIEAAINQVASFAESLASNALQNFFGMLFGGGFGGGGTPLGYGFGAYGKFANGGDFTVGGAGGTDSQLVSFVATPGEKVSVRTPGQAANGNSGGGGYLAVDVQVGVVNGNIVPLMVKVAGEVAGQKVRQEAPAAVMQTQRNRV